MTQQMLCASILHSTSLTIAVSVLLRTLSPNFLFKSRPALGCHLGSRIGIPQMQGAFVIRSDKDFTIGGKRQRPHEAPFGPFDLCQLDSGPGVPQVKHSSVG